MFSDWKKPFWLSAVMAVFIFVPFYVTGFSTDVWMRLVRIQEWAAADFPWQEQLMMAQNYPFGLEMHWTRPLDFIGYAFAWPFIPNWGLKKALEIMAWYVPILTMIVSIKGYFFGLRGYMTPRTAFFSFWLFFFGIGYSWGQATVGYFDHHIFHFALLIWVVALIARSFRVKDNRHYLVLAGVLTAIGTWMTAEFFINTYLVITPFILYWLFYGKSLRPAVVYSFSYTVCLFLAMTFDHPMAGLMTLDFYRVSMMHVILGGLNTLMLLGLAGLFKVIQTTFIRRLIYGVLGVSILGVVLLLGFSDVLMIPMVDPFMYHIWTKYVSEMRPLWEDWPGLLEYGILQPILALGLLIWAFAHLKSRYTPLIIIGASGVLFYGVLTILHVRTGISLNAFFVYLGAIFFSLVFFPREKSFSRSFVFIIFYLIFIGSHIKGDAILTRIKNWGVQHYLELYKKDKTIEVPDYLKPLFEKAVQEDENQAIPEKENNDSELNSSLNEQKNSEKNSDFQCVSNEKIWEIIRKDNQNGALFTDIFSAPQLVWETGKPTLGGPYHTNIEGLTDLFTIQIDRPPYNRAKALLKKHQVSQLYLFHPDCQTVLFKNHEGKNMPDTETMFHLAVYHETKHMPSWLTLEYEDPKTHIKIFRVKAEQ